MVKIRLSRTGRKNLATYKIVITPVREKRESSFIEYVGHYNPHTKELVIKKDRVEYWMSVGAQPTDTVASLLIRGGAISKPKVKGTFKDMPGKKKKERQAKVEAETKKAAEAKKEEPKEEEPKTE